jgi:ComF family protein
MFFSTFAKNAIGFVFPRLCIVCAERTSDDAWLCDRCKEALAQNFAKREACPKCGINNRISRCTCEYNWNFPFDSIFSVYDFDETIQAIVHEFKYSGKKRLAFDIGKMCVKTIPASFFEGMDMIVPAPLFFFRFLTRGYNQAEHFARGIFSQTDKKTALLPHVLIRRRPTKNQTGLSRKNRQINMQGAFFVPKRKRPIVRNKNIILVDDVVTTGATTRECAHALLSAGCWKIKVLSLARD